MANSDKYSNFKKLAKNEREGIDYQIRTLYGDNRNTRVLILAPHGGGIEPHTSRIAEEVAGEIFSLYIFEGLKRLGNFERLHITSTNFDEPTCLQLVKSAHIAVAIHGKSGVNRNVSVGGRDEELGDRIVKRLTMAGFQAEKETNPNLSGRDKQNICNQTILEEGVQLEITRGLRCALIDNSNGELSLFTGAIRQAIQEDKRLA